MTGLQPVAWPFGSSVKYPRQESNLIPDLRRVVCDPPHPEDIGEPCRVSARSSDHSKQERTDSNCVRRLWRPPALPGARSYSGCPGGVEPAAKAFTGPYAKPLHHRHHQ